MSAGGKLKDTICFLPVNNICRFPKVLKNRFKLIQKWVVYFIYTIVGQVAQASMRERGSRRVQRGWGDTHSPTQAA